MNQLQRAVSAYGQAARTLPPARQIVLLYDGALRRLREAREALVEGRVGERWRAVQKAAGEKDILPASVPTNELSQQTSGMPCRAIIRARSISPCESPLASGLSSSSHRRSI